MRSIPLKTAAFVLVALLSLPVNGADEPAKEAGYMVLPIRGMVGHHITDDTVSRCLKAAEAAKVRTIVLSIDSGGGLTSELDKITQRLVSWQNVPGQRVIAYVNPRAYSAAAIIAITCKDIFMAPSSTIGATAEVGAKRSGIIKIKSDSVLRASDRALAQFGGHDPALVEAMADPSGELWMRKEAVGNPTFTIIHRRKGGQGKNPNGPARATRIKNKEQLLTLTADDAAAYGLAKGVVKDVATIGQTLGIKPWVEEDDKLRTITQSLFEQAEASSKELERMVDLVEKALAATPATTLPAMAKQLSELRNAKNVTAKITQFTEKSAYFAGSIDVKSVERAGQNLDTYIKSMEARFEAEKERK